VRDIGGLNLEWIQSILSAEAGAFLLVTAKSQCRPDKIPRQGTQTSVPGQIDRARLRCGILTELPVVMAVVVAMVTRLSRQHNACKYCQCNDCEHQVTNLHGETS
jgi:hypothetical protein